MVLGANALGPLGRDARVEDLLFAEDTSHAGQFARPWKPRAMAQDAGIAEVASSKLRRPSAYNKSFRCTDVTKGDSAPFHYAVHRKGAPRWRGKLEILDIDETGATVEFQSQTLRAARNCERKTLGEKVAGGAEWNPASETMDPWGGSPLEALEKAQEPTGMPREADGDQDATSTDPPQDHSSMHKRGSSSDSRRLTPAPDSPPPPVQLPPSPSLLVQLPPPVPPFETRRTPPQPPVVELGTRTVALKTRLAAMAAKESKRRLTARSAM